MSTPRIVRRVLLLGGVAAGTIHAQGPAATSASSAQQASAADAAVKLYTIPESPAFTFLDITPAKITKPTTARDFVTALINAIDQSGKVRQGLAFEIEASRIVGRQPTLDEYQKRWSPLAIASRTQLSIATVRAGGDSSSTDVSYGVRIPLFDRGDPMADRAFTTDLVDAFSACPAPPPPLPSRPTGNREIDSLRAQIEAVQASLRDARIAEQKRCLGEAVKTAGEAYAKKHWNSATLSIAFAGGQQLISSATTDSRSLGNRFWLVGGMPLFGDKGQILGLLQYADLVPETATDHQRSLRYGLRATVGQPTFNSFIEFFKERRTADALPSLDRDGWSGGLEFRLSEELWLATGFGKTGDVSGKPTMVIANLKWGLAKQAQLAK